jgi:hypothetical protein
MATGMSDVWIMGELLVEIMRPKPGLSLHEYAEAASGAA